MIDATTAKPGPPLRSRIRDCGDRLRRSLRRVVEQVPVTAQSPMEHARVLGVHRTLAGRVLRGLKTDDPLASIMDLPRSEGLRMFLDAVGPRVAPDSLHEARAAVDELDGLVRAELGGWDGLDAAISAWLPEVRDRLELASRQQIYKGMCSLHGAQANVQLITSIYCPGASGKRCDVAVIMGLMGLRRVRPGTRITVSNTGPNPGTAKSANKDNAHPVSGGLLEPFCSAPLPELRTIERAGLVEHALEGDTIGASSEVDIVTLHIGRAVRPVNPPIGGTGARQSGSGGLTLPARTLLLNVLLHDDVWPGRTPELAVFDTRMRGLADPTDPDRQCDRMETMDSIQTLGRGAARFHASEVGRHAEMIAHACDRMGWDPERLRGYRCRAQFPLLHAQYCMIF